MIVFTGSDIFYYTIAYFLLFIGIEELVKWLKNVEKRKIDKKHKEIKKELDVPIAFYLVISNILSLIICNFLK